MSIINGFSRVFCDLSEKCVLIQIRFRRRCVNPPPWIPKIYHPVRSQLYPDDRILVEKLLNIDPTWQFPSKFQSHIANRHGICPSLISGIKNLPDCSVNAYNIDSSRRIGLVGRKIGMTLQWMKDGTRCLCTMIHFPDNVVLSANDPEIWYRYSPTGKLKAFGKRGTFWSQIVGALDQESVFYSHEYRRIFERAGVPCKKFMAGFLVSEDAIVPQGTKLDVRHFNVGQCVTVSGKTIDWGFQGVMHRWGMKGMQKNKTTKSHRRVGSIGVKGEAKVWVGRRLPGHMGYEWRNVSGLVVLRINPIKQVIYVLGCVPGDIGEMLLVKDSMAIDKRVRDPPFPTFYPDIAEKSPGSLPLDNDEINKIYNITSQDIYHPKLFRFHEPSIVYTEADETKSQIRDKSRAKTAQLKKG